MVWAGVFFPPFFCITPLVNSNILFKQVHQLTHKAPSIPHTYAESANGWDIQAVSNCEQSSWAHMTWVHRASWMVFCVAVCKGKMELTLNLMKMSAGSSIAAKVLSLLQILYMVWEPKLTRLAFTGLRQLICSVVDLDSSRQYKPVHWSGVFTHLHGALHYRFDNDLYLIKILA